MEYQYEYRYNIVPNQKVPVIIPGLNAQERQLVEMTWGLIPNWVRDLSIYKPLINARAETLAEKPSFRTAFKKRRCLIPSDGSYGWQVIEGKKEFKTRLF